MRIPKKKIPKKMRAEDFRELPLQDQVDHLLRANRVLKSTLEQTLRQGVATELAKMLHDGKKPPWTHESVVGAFDDALVSYRKAFPQKRAQLLHFYAQAFSLMPRKPTRILEIGVKGGASLELWKALFPEARIVGVDIVPFSQALSEGITVVEADQSKPETIAALGERFGPFDVVIDDGSHIGEHMVNSLVALLPHLNAGSLYVLEDISVRDRDTDQRGDDGKIRELVSAAISYFGKHKGEWVAPPSSISEETQLIFPRIASLLLDRRVIAFFISENADLRKKERRAFGALQKEERRALSALQKKERRALRKRST